MNLKGLATPDLLKRMNDHIAKASENKSLCLHLAIWIRAGGMLIEARNDMTADWLKDEGNLKGLKGELGPKVTF